MRFKKSTPFKKDTVSSMEYGKRGNILFPMAIALTITGISIFYFYFSSYQLRKLEDQKLVHVSNLAAHASSLKALLNSQVAFMNSAQLAANGDFYRCLNDPEFNCNVANDQNFTLVDDAGTVYSDSNNTSAGIDSGTLPCNSFPSLGCPFRFELKWSHLCIGTGPCNSPEMTITGRLLIGSFPSLKFNINPVNYEFEVRVR